MKNKKLKLSVSNGIGDEELEKMLSNYSYWESKVKKHDTSSDVSWEDKNMIRLEIKNISNWIKEGSYILDAGCSNGYSTFEIANTMPVQIRAFDFNERAIQIARTQQPLRDPYRRISFYHGNILNIEEPEETFDVAYTTRVVINIPSWHLQKKAILEIHRILKPNGLYLMSEAFSGSLQKLNALRSLAQMKPLSVPDFNLYIEEERLETFIKPYFQIDNICRFSSIYYAASRFLRYLTMESGEKDSYDNEINNLFSKYSETENSGDFGIQKLYVLRKK
jgi:ubiquinone/menaquinone biosynthesis C-methylase UbiE